MSNFTDDYLSREQKESGDNNYQDFTSQQSMYEEPVSYEKQGANGLQITSLVLGIISIPVCCCYGIPSIVLGLIGLILGIIGQKKNPGNGVGVAGIICSIIGLLLGIVMAVYMILIAVAIYSGTGPFADILQNNPAFQQYMQNGNAGSFDWDALIQSLEAEQY